MGFKPVYEKEKDDLKVKFIKNDLELFQVIVTGTGKNRELNVHTKGKEKEENALKMLLECREYLELEPKMKDEIAVLAASFYEHGKEITENETEKRLTIDLKTVPFTLIAEVHNKVYVLELLNTGTEDVIIRDSSSRTPLWDSVRKIKDFKAAVSKKKNMNLTPISEAIEHGITLIQGAWSETEKRWSEKGEGEPEILLLCPGCTTSYTTVHPAINFGNPTCVGVVLPMEDKEMKEKNVYCLITDDGRIIPTTEKSLENEKIRLTEPTVSTENWWNAEHVDSYLKGTSQEVSLKKAFEIIKKKYEENMDFPHKNYYNLLPLWVIGTYFHPLFHAYPYLHLTGSRECGKSKAIRLTTLMGFNGIGTSNMTPSSMFRIIQSKKPTLGVDESENLRDKEKGYELRSVLLGGYEKGNPVYRMEKEKINGTEKLVYKRFENYCPKIIGNIEGIEDVLGSRVIPITMLRTNKKQGNTEVFLEDKAWPEIRDVLYRLMFELNEEVKLNYENSKYEIEGVNNRELQLWRPILTIAKMISEELYEEMTKMAQEKAEEKENISLLESFDMTLLQALHQMSIENPLQFGSSILASTIRDYLVEHFDENEKYATPRRIGRTLSRLGFKTKKHTNKGSGYLISIEDIIDRMKRYTIQGRTGKVTDDQGKLVLTPPSHEKKPENAHVCALKAIENTRNSEGDAPIENVIKWCESQGYTANIIFDVIIPKLVNDGEAVEIKPGILRLV